MTKTEQIAWLRGRAEIIEASGDLALATQARAEADAMERPVCPRPAVVHKCDA